jgi:malic enzyme
MTTSTAPAIVVLAALWNALRVVGKKLSEVRIAVSGVGAAGSAIIRLLLAQGPATSSPVTGQVPCGARRRSRIRCAGGWRTTPTWTTSPAP